MNFYWLQSHGFLSECECGYVGGVEVAEMLRLARIGLVLSLGIKTQIWVDLTMSFGHTTLPRYSTITLSSTATIENGLHVKAPDQTTGKS